MCGRYYEGRGQMACSLRCSNVLAGAKRRKPEQPCEHCGKMFKQRNRARFCSQRCSTMYAIGHGTHNVFAWAGTEKHPPNYKGGKSDDKGYVRIYAPNHYPGQKTNYIMEHRLVMEKTLGRQLTRKEFVHHRNGIKNDNRPENLELVARNPHAGEVTCPHCQGTFFLR